MDKELLKSLNGARVVFYMRASTTEQGEKGTSFDAQRQAVKNMVDELGLIIVKEYEEMASGEFDGRPILKEATQYAKTAKCPAIIVAYLSRHSRNRGFTAQWERDNGLVCLAGDSYNKGDLEGGVLEVIDDHYIRQLKEKQRNAYIEIQEKFARGEKHVAKKSGEAIDRLGAPNLKKAQKNASKGNKDRAMQNAQELFYEIKAIVEQWGEWKGYNALCDALNQVGVKRRQKEQQNEVQKLRGDKKQSTTHKIGGLKSALFRMKQETRSYKGKELPPLLNDEQRAWLTTEMTKSEARKAREQAAKIKQAYKHFRESGDIEKLKKLPAFKDRKITLSVFKEIIDSGGKLSLYLTAFTLVIPHLRI